MKSSPSSKQLTGPRAKLSRSDKRRLCTVSRRAEAWFAQNGREFPWRLDRASTYERVCVEVLLQRTRAETVSRFYDKFFSKFPSWQAIAATSIEELQDTLKPIGLWERRARTLAGLAAHASSLNGEFPNNRDTLQEIPAIGQYVANAIFLFQHGRPEPLLDSNMARVIERYIRPRKLADIRHDPWLQSAGKQLVATGDPIKVNWAILDIGGTLCTPVSPSCQACPLRKGCTHAKKTRDSRTGQTS